MSPERANRVADFIREELAEIVSQRMRDPRVRLLSVTDARVSRDLSFADVYVSSIETEDQQSRDELVETLNRAAGFLRSEVARRHTMRTTPRLRFHYDRGMVEGPRMEALIQTALNADRHNTEPASAPSGGLGGEGVSPSQRGERRACPGGPNA